MGKLAAFISNAKTAMLKGYVSFGRELLMPKQELSWRSHYRWLCAKLDHYWSLDDSRRSIGTGMGHRGQRLRKLSHS